MWPAALTRLLKRRLIYIVVIIIFLVYVITKTFHKNRNHFYESDNFMPERSKPLLWRSFEEHLLPDNPKERINPTNITCRNSLQGPTYLVDDRGFVCQTAYMLHNGCCDVEYPTSKYYTCDTCDTESHCCGIYEYCVSCCLHPQQRPILELALDVIKGRQALLYTQVEDQYELCLIKCRTNSHSVQHENRYRDVEHRFCYGPTQAHESQLEVLGLGTK